MTTYEEMKKRLGTRRGPRPMTPEQREQRMAERKAETARRTEARRRAWFVLENKYNEEFRKVFNEEYETLKRTKKMAA